MLIMVVLAVVDMPVEEVVILVVKLILAGPKGEGNFEHKSLIFIKFQFLHEKWYLQINQLFRRWCWPLYAD